MKTDKELFNCHDLTESIRQEQKDLGAMAVCAWIVAWCALIAVLTIAVAVIVSK